MRDSIHRIKRRYAYQGVKGLATAAWGHIKLRSYQMPARTISYFYTKTFRKPKIPTFFFQGEKYDYLYSRKNFTHLNMRTVEVPIAWKAIEGVEPHKVLEVGNVLSNYYPPSHQILDKYEKGKNVINQDAVEFSSEERYDRIVSISTLEHIGWDWPEGKDPGKIPSVIKNLKRHLSPNGILLVTMPVGYNSFLDALVEKEKLGLAMYFMKRVSSQNEWMETPYEEVRGVEFARPFPNGNAVLIGIYKNSSRGETGNA
jgi:hypothetical protein